ncbi:hypothetical protein M9H77_06705 [Catharanthus roseus]|uniref:Uncharacterized protein n=1 Tax=Catharanthus roseus TaxID=4058 RepID=A0ACC0BSU0_CATRO|nr:hypothetical protein M9H77_06705 [Catharanthus roseus]
MRDETASVLRLEDAFAHDELYRKLHTNRDDYERAGQFDNHCSDEFWTEEQCQNRAPMPTDMEFMYEIGSRPSSQTRGPMTYCLCQLYRTEAVVVRFNTVGISISELGSLDPPLDWQMHSYPSGEGMTTARPSDEDDDPRGEDDDHLPPSQFSFSGGYYF